MSGLLNEATQSATADGYTRCLLLKIPYVYLPNEATNKI